MKKQNQIFPTVIFGIVIFLAALIGPRVAHGYIHPADPIVLLAAMLLPIPHAMLAAGIAGVAVDLIKGLYLLSPATLVVRLAMVLAVKGLLKTKPAQKHPDLMVSVAALIPVPIYYLSELINQLIQGQGLASFGAATITLQADLVQGVASILLFILLYDAYKGILAGREEIRRIKEAEKENAETEKEDQTE